jgi:hypothetical protein
MRITHDSKNGKLWSSQHNYIEKVLERFNMRKFKLVSTTLPSHFKLSIDKCPKSEENKKDIKFLIYMQLIV